MSVTKWFHSASGRDALFSLQNCAFLRRDGSKIDADDIRVIVPGYFFFMTRSLLGSRKKYRWTTDAYVFTKNLKLEIY